jgi:AraC-like DNA-binding protein
MDTLLRSSKLRVSSLSGFSETCDRFGVDPSYLINELCIDASVLAGGEGTLSQEELIDLLNLAAVRSGCDYFGFELSKAQGVDILGRVGLMIETAGCVYSALEDLQKYFSLHNNATEVVVTCEANVAVLSFHTLCDANRDGLQHSLLCCGTTLNIFRALLGAAWSPLKLLLAHDEVKGDNELCKELGCPVEYNRELSGIVFDMSIFNVRLSGDNGLRDSVTQFLRKEKGSDCFGFVDKVIREIIRKLVTDDVSLIGVSSGLNLSPREVQRRLGRDGLKFKQVAADVKYYLGKKYLVNTSMSIAYISSILGYSEANAFSRAFKLRAGYTPVGWRKHNSLLRVNEVEKG